MFGSPYMGIKDICLCLARLTWVLRTIAYIWLALHGFQANYNLLCNLQANLQSNLQSNLQCTGESKTKWIHPAPLPNNLLITRRVVLSVYIFIIDLTPPGRKSIITPHSYPLKGGGVFR